MTCRRCRITLILTGVLSALSLSAVASSIWIIVHLREGAFWTFEKLGVRVIESGARTLTEEMILVMQDACIRGRLETTPDDHDAWAMSIASDRVEGHRPDSWVVNRVISFDCSPEICSESRDWSAGMPVTEVAVLVLLDLHERPVVVVGMIDGSTKVVTRSTDLPSWADPWVRAILMH